MNNEMIMKIFIDELASVANRKSIRKMIFKDGVLVKTYPYSRKKAQHILDKII
ncbi:hypothetical protein HW132_31875 [Brasilonema sp. CT11]|nr:hypothetical protein [Brasilonema sp. CT11]